MADIKAQALSSTFWSFFETFGNQGLQFVVGIILARLLLPEDFGMIGVLAIFMGIAGVLVDSGFKTSIIRTKEVTAIDFSTIFYVNMIVSIIVGLLLFVSASTIALLFNKPELVNITRVLALIPVINGFGLVQTALQYKKLQFKRNAIISISANLIAGIIAIYMALHGFSYWSLIWRAVIVAALYNSFLWITSTWHPQLIFSIKILKKHFRFSSKLLLTGLLDSFFNNIYSFIFGKFYTFSDLGFFTRGKGYVDMVTKTLSVTIQKVNTPLLAASGKVNEYKIDSYSALLRVTALVIFPATALLIAVAQPMIIFLIGEKWLLAVPFLQILALSGIIYPLLNANSSLFEVLGKSNLILKSALINRPFQIIILLITINFSALTVAWGIVIHGIFCFFLSFYFVYKTTNRKILDIVKALIPAINIALISGVTVYVIGIIADYYLVNGIVFGVQLICGIIIIFILFRLMKINEYNMLRSLLLTKVNQILKAYR